MRSAGALERVGELGGRPSAAAIDARRKAGVEAERAVLPVRDESEGGSCGNEVANAEKVGQSHREKVTEEGVGRCGFTGTPEVMR